MLGGSQFFAFGVGGYTIILIPETLPAITTHDIDVMIFQFLIVIGIEIEQGVALGLMVFIAFARTVILISSVHGGSKIGHIFTIVILLDVIAHIQIEAQVFQSVHLVVEGNVTDRTFCFFEFVSQFQIGNRIRSGQRDGFTAIHPGIISQTYITFIIFVNGTGRIKRDGTANHAC